MLPGWRNILYFKQDMEFLKFNDQPLQDTNLKPIMTQGAFDAMQMEHYKFTIIIKENILKHYFNGQPNN